LWGVHSIGAAEQRWLLGDALVGVSMPHSLLSSLAEAGAINWTVVFLSV